MTGDREKTEWDEFAIIERFFAPLVEADPLAFGLKDDAALLRPEAGCDIVVTADAMIAGVHFFENDPPGEIARKLLRVNLSDLAAKGARPLSYVLTTAWPRTVTSDWIEAFAQGLAADQARFGIHLIGGDTVATDGPLSLSLTAFGQVRRGAMIPRGGAKPGDVLCVSGTIGDGVAGLHVARGQAVSLKASARDYLLARYRLPQPRLALGAGLAGLASACADVSDGLMADAGHIAEASGVALDIEAAAVPISAAARATGLGLADLVAGGDDYELLFTLEPSIAHDIERLGSAGDVAVTRIGQVRAGRGARLLDQNGARIEISKTGYRHF